MDQMAQPMDKARLTEPARAVEAFLGEFLDARPYPANLREAVRYALLGGGKRLRPVLAVHCCRAVGGTADIALPPAGAIELIHTFSLVHDDLPAMDNDDLRRGRPTLHRHTSEAMAILAGDGMTLLAFEMIFAKVRPASLAARVASELATATNEMIAGQVYDTLPDFDESIDGLTRLQIIHRHKTGALLRCACRMGAIVGGADEAGLDAITRYGETIGLMFQVVDDILDVTQTTEHLGKTARKDEAQGKLTYPSVLGLDASRAEVTRLQAQAHAALSDLGEPAAPLRDLCDYMAVRSN
jgi:geranylgeranyl diphosphate synthase type II